MDICRDFSNYCPCLTWTFAAAAPANSFHITAYFMKRWVNLYCAVGKRYHGLRVFPDRLIVCVSKLESDPSAWTCENGVLKEQLSKGTSEYFTKFAENKKLKINLNEQIKQDILKEIVKMTKTKSSTSKPQINEDSKKVYLDSVDLQTGNRKNDCQASLSPQSEVKCSSTGLLKDWISTAEGNLEIPALELEIYVNQSQPDDVSSQQKPCSAEWLKSSLISENAPCSSKSALLGPKQSQEVTKTQAQQKTYGSEEKLEHFQKVSSEEAPLTPSNTEMNKCCDDHLGPFLEKTLLNSRLFFKQDLMKTASEDESVTLGKNLSHPLSDRNNIEQTKENEPSTTSGEFPVMPSSCLELQCVSSEKLTQKRKKEGEIGLRKLKLRRLKKS